MHHFPQKINIRRIRWIVCLVASLMACWGATSWADVIHLKNGNTLEGIVQDRRHGKVYVLTNVGEVVLNEADIDQSREAPPDEGAMSRVRIFLQTEQTLSAISEMRSFLENDQETSAMLAVDESEMPRPLRALTIKRTLLSQSDAIKSSLQRVAPEQGAAILSFLESLADEKHADNERDTQVVEATYLVALAVWQRSLGHPDKALDSLARIESALPTIHGELMEEGRAIAIERVCYGIASHQYEEMKRALAALTFFDPQFQRSMMVWSWLQVAGRYRDRGEFSEALKVYRRYILPRCPALALYKIDATLDIARSQMSVMRSYESLLALYDEFGVPLLSDKIEGALAEILENAGRDALERNDVDKAVKYFQRLDLVREGSADKLLLLTELENRRGKLAADDALGHYQLGVWCSEKGLYKEARDCLEIAQEHPDIAELARKQWMLIDTTESLEQFDVILQAYNDGRFMEVADRGESFLARFQLSDKREEVRKLLTSAMVELTNELNQRPEVALSLYDQAQRLAHLEKYDESLTLLDQVVLDYGDTPVASKARVLKNALLNQLEAKADDRDKFYVDEPELRRTYRSVFREMPTAIEADAMDNPDLRDEVLALTADLRPHLNRLNPNR